MRTLAFATAVMLACAAASSSAQQPRPDRRLAQELAALVASYRARLPIQQPNGITVTDIQVRDTEVIYSLRLATNMDAAAENRFRAALPGQACAHPVARSMFERGGTYTYRVTDASGDSFTVSIDRC